MSDFTPNTKIYLGNVPFDPSYKHVRLFDDRETQRSAIAGRCTFGLNREDYTYQRLNNTLKVPYNAERLYQLNYCMFQNKNYGDRWFYAFITNVEYVSENTSRLWLQTDEFQTWFLDSSIRTSYVEREHVNDDTVGAHIKDEGINPGTMTVMQYAIDNDEMNLVPVVQCAVEPKTDGTYVNNGGDVYSGMYSGTSMSAFLTVQEFQDFLAALASNGQQDAISSVYMVPRFLLGDLSGSKKSEGYGYWVPQSWSSVSTAKNYEFGNTNLNGYIPKNNKMFCYPFVYIEITNFNGNTQQLRSELFGSDGTIYLERTGSPDVNGNVVYIPRNYNGIPRATEMALPLPSYPTCAWVYQTFMNNYGQSNYTWYVPFTDTQMQLNSMVDNPSVKAGLDIADRTVGVLTDVASLMGQAATSPKNITKAAAELIPSTISTANSAVQAVGTSAYDSMQMQADLAKAVRQPNTVRGGTNSSVTLVGIGSYTMGIRKYACSKETAKMCDDYLSAYGYNVSEFKQPNLTGRRSWNYVKTIGMQLHGDIPTTAMQTIQNIFDNGVTLWHTWEIGNYSLDNSIV